MQGNNFSKKRIINACIITFILVMILVIALLLTFRYYIEGEKKLPFNLKEINIVSTAESDINQNEENSWKAEILQKNDIFLVIQKNSDYKKDCAIKKVSIENFNIIKNNEDMVIDIYRPTTSVDVYEYSDEYKIENSLEYLGGQSTSTETLQINNQGGIIGFSVTAGNLGEYVFSENENLPSDGRLLKKAGLDEESIKFQVSFDLIIETESEQKFKANIVLDLPTGNILKDGVGVLKDNELTNVVFKRL